MRKRIAQVIFGFCLAQLLAGIPLAGALVTPPATSTGSQHAYHEPAQGMFLVARRDFTSPFFHNTVIFLLQHDEEASIGVIVNRPRKQRLSEVVEGVRGSWLQDLPVYHGGPVEPHELTILVSTSKPLFLTEPVTEDIHATVYPQLLHDPVLQEEPGITLRCYAGFASWSPGQLEDELRRGYWDLMDADPALIFGDATENLWDTLINQLEPVTPVEIKQ
jgi:putative transcriptional regulator